MIGKMKEEYILDSFNLPTAHCTFEFMAICDKLGSLHIKKLKLSVYSRRYTGNFNKWAAVRKKYRKAVDIRGNGSIKGREIDTPKVFRIGKSLIVYEHLKKMKMTDSSTERLKLLRVKKMYKIEIAGNWILRTSKQSNSKEFTIITN